MCIYACGVIIRMSRRHTQHAHAVVPVVRHSSIKWAGRVSLRAKALVDFLLEHLRHSKDSEEKLVEVLQSAARLKVQGQRFNDSGFPA